MQIVDARTTKFVLFRQIEIGECFESYNLIYLRVYPAHDENSGNHFNAISLIDGEEFYFEGDDSVHPINVHIVVNDPQPPYEKGSYRDNY